jgi:hypothetical protein
MTAIRLKTVEMLRTKLSAAAHLSHNPAYAMLLRRFVEQDFSQVSTLKHSSAVGICDEQCVCKLSNFNTIQN